MIREAKEENIDEVVLLAQELWPRHNIQDLTQEFLGYLKNAQAKLFLYYEKCLPIAFIQCQLRNDYVEGASSSPVAYIEGLYVKREYRFRGIAEKLLLKSEDWARSMECLELASDCELVNEDSYQFHLKCHFQEVNRLICFIKKL